MSTIPTHTAVQIDNPTSDWHDSVGFIRHNHQSGVVKACDECPTREVCAQSACTNGETLSEDQYIVVFNPDDETDREFQHCEERFTHDDLVVRGC